MHAIRPLAPLLALSLSLPLLAQEPDASTALPSTASTDVLDSLARAIEAGVSVWIGYVDNHGTTTQRVVDPISLDAGWLSAFDHLSEQVRTCAVHRISAVAAVRAD